MPTDIRIEKFSNFSARIMVGGLSESISASGLAPATRLTPTFELGCFSGPATALATFGAIGVPQGPVLAATVLPPINADGSSTFNAKRGVVPLKFSLASDGSPTCGLPPATLNLTRTGGTSPGPIDESVYTGPSDSGSQFRITDCEYHYNLQARALGPGTCLAEILLNGAVVGDARFELK